MSDDPIDLSELEQLVDREAARLEPRFGRCPFCRRYASSAIGLSSITWSVCQTCAVRWVAGYDLLVRVEDLEIVDELIKSLEKFTEIPRWDHSIMPTTFPGGFAPMRRDTTASLGIDPRAFQTEKDNPVLPGLTREERVRVTDLLVRDLREHPLTERNLMTGKLVPRGDHIWDRIRDVSIDDNGRTVADVLQRPEIAAPSLAVRDCVALFLQLQDRRAALEEQLAGIIHVVDALRHSEETLTK